MSTFLDEAENSLDACRKKAVSYMYLLDLIHYCQSVKSVKKFPGCNLGDNQLYYMPSSMSRQDESNPALRLAT